MGEYFNLHNLEQEQEGEGEGEEAEETLSLRDLPLDHNNNSEFQNQFNGNHNPRSSSDLFEFFNDFGSVDMCPAGEIMFCGKLVAPTKYHDSIPKPFKQDRKSSDFIRKRSDSLSEIQGFITHRSSSIKARVMRNSRSLDYRKEKETMERSSSTRKAVPKPPRWYYVFMMFGLAKIPTEMELTDIKNRQSRQNPPALFPPVINNNNNYNNTSAVTRRSGGTGKGSYGLISVLSCKDHASVSVATTSFAC